MTAATLPRGAVVLVQGACRRPAYRARVDAFDARRGFYVGLRLGLTPSERKAGYIPPLCLFRAGRILAVRQAAGFQRVLPGVLV